MEQAFSQNIKFDPDAKKKKNAINSQLYVHSAYTSAISLFYRWTSSMSGWIKCGQTRLNRASFGLSESDCFKWIKLE